MTEREVTKEELELVDRLKQMYKVITKNYGDWIGQPMMNPKDEIGLVVDDSNGWSRYLDVKFLDGHIETLVLRNTQENPKESQKWRWLWDGKNVSKGLIWSEWGK